MEGVTEIRFEIEKEVWNIYELYDGAELRIRPIVLHVLKRIPNPSDPTVVEFGCETYNPVSISVPADYKWKGTPSKREFTKEDIVKAVKSEVEFRPLVEDWNLYRLEDRAKLKVKLVVSQVQRCRDIFDTYGIPIYNVISSTVVSYLPKEK